MTHIHPVAILIGRVLIAAIFIMSALNKIANPAQTQQYMQAMGMTWATSLFLVGAIILELGGGLSVLTGFWARAGATALLLFMIPTTWIFHSNFGDQNQMIHFMKNLGMMGGLLYVAGFGAGPLSLDAWLAGARTAPVTLPWISARDRRRTGTE